VARDIVRSRYPDSVAALHELDEPLKESQPARASDHLGIHGEDGRSAQLMPKNSSVHMELTAVVAAMPASARMTGMVPPGCTLRMSPSLITGRARGPWAPSC